MSFTPFLKETLVSWFSEPGTQGSSCKKNSDCEKREGEVTPVL